MKKSDEFIHGVIQQDVHEFVEKHSIPVLVMAYRLGDSLAVVGAGKESEMEVIAKMVEVINDALHERRDEFKDLIEEST